MARRAQENFKLFASSFISDLFVGHMRSTLVCQGKKKREGEEEV